MKRRNAQSLHLSLKESLAFDLDCRSISPANFADMTLAQVGACSIQYGRGKRRLDELFEIEGTTEHQQLEIHDASAKMHYVGYGLDNGRIVINGTVGDFAGGALSGGELVVNGSTGNYAASGMRDGLVHIKGDCGDYAGGAGPSDNLGMRGGTLLITGSAGEHLGARMRRGIAITQQNAGDFCASNMVAGTIIVVGKCGGNAGLGMRRGTLLLFNKPRQILSTFGACGEFSLPILAVLRRHLHTINHQLAARLSRVSSVKCYRGDIGADGQGEILIAGQIKNLTAD